jgi:hypothetical protein
LLFLYVAAPVRAAQMTTGCSSLDIQLTSLFFDEYVFYDGIVIIARLKTSYPSLVTSRVAGMNNL